MAKVFDIVKSIKVNKEALQGETSKIVGEIFDRNARFKLDINDDKNEINITIKGQNKPGGLDFYLTNPENETPMQQMEYMGEQMEEGFIKLFHLNGLTMQLKCTYAHVDENTYQAQYTLSYGIK